ncbi:MAG: hypothetical protein JNJ41_02595 [Bacteroidia bacterium]|nr:hypothetical protein [Bacteroidia bacterium]
MKKIFTFLLLSISIVSLSQPITGSGAGGGPVGYIPRFNSASNIINSNIYQSGVNIGIATTTPTNPLHIQANNAAGYGLLVNQIGAGQSGINLWNTNVANPGRNWGLWSTGAGNVGGAGNFIIRDVTASQTRLFISGATGQVLIGDPTAVTLPVGYKLYVQTGILTEKVKVALINTVDWADYVFEKNYKLKSLEEVDSYISANEHLPGVPSASELVEQGGIDLGKMDAKLMEKIEELTLYSIQLNKKNKELSERLSKLEAAK